MFLDLFILALLVYFFIRAHFLIFIIFYAAVGFFITKDSEKFVRSTFIQHYPEFKNLDDRVKEKLILRACFIEGLCWPLLLINRMFYK